MILTLLAALAAPAAPATPTITPPPQPCLPNTPIPAPLTAWRNTRPVAQGWMIGRAVELKPLPVAIVRLAVQPSRPLSGAYVASGMFEVKAAGTYTVAAGGVDAPIQPLWLDVAGADNKPLSSVAHGHGAPCSSITKAVDFQLTPGRYTFLATGLASAAPVRVLVVRKP